MERPIRLGAALLCNTLVTDRSVLIAVQPGLVPPFLLGCTIVLWGMAHSSLGYRRRAQYSVKFKSAPCARRRQELLRSARIKTTTTDCFVCMFGTHFKREQALHPNRPFEFVVV